MFAGVPGGIRTHGLSLRRRTLYPAELQRLILNWDWQRSLFPVRQLVEHNLRRRVLYPAELYGRVWYMIIARSKSNCNPLFSFFWGGRCNATLGGRRFIQLSYWGILCIIVDFLKFNALGNKCVECFSQRSDRLHCNRDDGKVVASKFVEKTVILGFAFE